MSNAEPKKELMKVSNVKQVQAELVKARIMEQAYQYLNDLKNPGGPVEGGIDFGLSFSGSGFSLSFGLNWDEVPGSITATSIGAVDKTIAEKPINPITR
jgi:hypothetical protein